MMAVGATLGFAAVPLPFVEVFIALSGIMLGVAIALGWKAKAAAALAIVGVFAIFHGYAHGAELPKGSGPQAYAAGFVLGTGLLHGVGILMGLLDRKKPVGPQIVRVGGGLIALAGGWFLLHAV